MQAGSARWAWAALLLACGDGTLSTPEVVVLELPEAGAPPDDAASPGFDVGRLADMGWPVDGRVDPTDGNVGPAPDAVGQPAPDAFVLPVLPDVGPPAPATCEAAVWTLPVAGQSRRVRFDVPAAPAQGAPRVLLLHGNGDTADNFCATTSLCRFLTGRGALVATPDGRHRVINVGGQQANLAWNAYDATAANEDVALVAAILAEASRRCGAGPLYVWGHSQGGYFGFLVAMVHDAHGAVVGSAADPMPGFRWQPARPFPVAFVIGTLDFGIDAARTTARRLESAGHPVRSIEVEGARHGGYLRGHDPELADFIGLR